MDFAFYPVAVIALLSTAVAITRRSVVHALLYLVVSLLSVAVIFYLLGAPFAAALEVIIYAGAIVVLFVFAVMLLGVAPGGAEEWAAPRSWRAWAGPALLAFILLAELLYVLSREPIAGAARRVGPAAVGRALFGPYALGVELTSLLLLAGVVGAYHLGRRGEGEGAPS